MHIKWVVAMFQFSLVSSSHVAHNYHEEEELSYATLAHHHPLTPSSRVEMFMELWQREKKQSATIFTCATVIYFIKKVI